MKTVNFLCSVFCSFLNTVAAWLDLLAIKVFNCLYSVLSLFLHVVAAIVSPVGNTGCPLPGLCPLFVSSVTVARAVGSKNCRLMRSGPLFLSSHCCCMARPVGNEAAVSSLCSVPF